MSTTRHLITAIVLCALVELPLWSVTGAGGKDLTDTHTSLYRLDPVYGRTFVPLNALTLQDSQFGSPLTIGPVSGGTVAPPLSDMHFSPRGTTLLTLTNTCTGCQLWHAKYITIRVIDTSTGMVRTRFHPQRGPLAIQTVSDDGSRLGVLLTAGAHPSWLTLDGRTGKVLRSINLPDFCCREPLLDASGSRLYLAESTAAHQLSVAAFDLASGTQLASLTLPSVPAGSWGAGPGITQYWAPGLAISPDGQQLAVLDGRADTLTVIDTPSMKVASIRSIAPPRGALERLGALLGLTPTTAEAKGLREGATYTLRFSRDGRSLYLLGSRASVDASHETHTDLGIERIDVASGELRATDLSGRAVWWRDEAADGSALYAVTSAFAGEEDCPCILQRLDPTTLDVTATRTFPYEMPRLYVLAGA